MIKGYNQVDGLPIGLSSIVSLGFPPLINPYPALDLDFINNQALDSRVTFSRGSQATFFNSAGVLSTASNDVARFTYNPSTLQPQGLLIEEQRTNSIRNNTMQGAVAGTPGTLPTNWSYFTARTGLTTQVVGTGTENGITYLDFKVSGTPNAAGNFSISFEGSTSVAAATGQSWCLSTYAKLAAGSFTGISGFFLQMDEYTNVGGYVRTNASSAQTITSAGLATQRVNFSTALSGGATVAFVSPYILFTLTGVAIDITLRIGMPQLELGAFATSVIPTTTTALTRNADVASMTGTNFSSWYNASEGTVYFDAGIPINYSTGFPTFISINDSTGNNNIQPAINAGGDVINVEMKTSGSVVAGFYPAYISGFTKVCFAYKVNDVNYAKDGVAGTTDTSASIPTVSQINIGSNQAPSNFLNGTIRRIAYYPTRLADAQLQALTA